MKCPVLGLYYKFSDYHFLLDLIVAVIVIMRFRITYLFFNSIDDKY